MYLVYISTKPYTGPVCFLEDPTHQLQVVFLLFAWPVWVSAPRPDRGPSPGPSPGRSPAPSPSPRAGPLPGSQRGLARSWSWLVHYESNVSLIDHKQTSPI